MDINSLRAARNTDFSKLASEFEREVNPESAKSYDDTRFWKPERDKAGNASATIRFLPKTQNDELPWVKLWTHGFKGPTGRWYIENSLTTIGLPDPVSELNTKLWNSTEDDKSPERKQARDQKRKLNYISNVLIINDPKHPENNGQVKLFKFGKKIFDKIMDKARPTFEDQDPVNVFDFWEGANFKLRMKNVDGYPNYDSSEFESVAPLGDDDAIVSVATRQYTLAEFTDPKNFKSYDELKAKLESVLNGTAAPTTSAAAMAAEEFAPSRPMPSVGESKPAPAPKAKAATIDEDDDDVMSYFQSIADEE